ncbi:MAG: LPS-assembly protein LptD [Bacteroidales bacterium]|nr:LPS-assembly protein LptD [Bacteroidales bacterium]
MYTRPTYRFFIVFFFCLMLFAKAGRGQNTLDSLDNQKKKSSIESQIDRSCNDSTIQDFSKNKIYYYGGAVIKYDDIEIQADYVEFDFEKHTVFAKGMPDSTGKIVGKPVFSQAGQKYLTDEMTFNFDTKKGVIRKVFTEDAQGYLHGDRIKKMDDGKINIRSGSFTTCSNQDHPHYEFHFNKAIVIPDDKIVAKMMFVKLEETPLPVAIPFALIPNSKGQRSGIIIPSFGESANRGFYFENGGYYWAINEKMDLQLIGDIYTRGSWAVKPTFRYVNRYKFNGSLAASYAINKVGVEGSADYTESTDFKIRWVHKQDAKARPKSSFSADVYIVSNNYNKYNAISTTEYLSNTFQSSIAYQTNFANKLYLTVNGSHSQNTLTHQMTITLPEITLSMNRLYPLKNVGKPGKKHWYSELNLNYTGNAKNYISMADSLFFVNGWLDHMQNGMQHRVPINLPIKLFKHFTWTTSVNLTDKMYLQYYEKSWDIDTAGVGYVRTDTIPHFRNVFTYDASSNITTKLYGMLNFKKGPIRAIRHVFTPTIGFSFNPDYSDKMWDYYSSYIDGNGVEQIYSYFQGSIYGAPPGQRSGRITYSLSNNLEIKVPSRKDTITGLKKVTLIENLTLSGNYDLAKDSLNWSYLSISGRTTLFKNLSIQYSSTWDPYVLDSTGQKNLNKFEFDVNNRLFRKKSVSWNFSASYSLNNKTFKKKDKGKTKEEKPIVSAPNASEEELNDIHNNPNGYIDWSTSWSLSLSYNLRISNTPTYINYILNDYRTTVQTISISGDVSLSPKWKVSAQTGWDFETKKISYTSLTIYRDLHCWEMRFNVIPYGTYKSWNFQINVKAAALQDLKLTKKKDYRDNY